MTLSELYDYVIPVVVRVMLNTFHWSWRNRKKKKLAASCLELQHRQYG